MDKYNLSFKNLQKDLDKDQISLFEKICIGSAFAWLFFIALPQMVAFFFHIEGGLK